MLTSSRKAKGRNLQKFVVESLLQEFPQELKPDDITSRSMGAMGMDVMLSPNAQDYIPFAFECKNQEALKGLYTMWKQAEANRTVKLAPALVLKMNKEKPLVVIDFDTFIKHCIRNH